MDGVAALNELRRTINARYQQAIVISSEWVNSKDPDWHEQYQKAVAIVQTFDVVLADIDRLLRDPRVLAFDVADYRKLITEVA